MVCKMFRLSKCSGWLQVLCGCLILVTVVHVLAVVLKLTLPRLLSYALLGMDTALQNELIFPFLDFFMINAHYSLSMLSVCMVAYVGWFFINTESINPVDLTDYDWGEETFPDTSNCSRDELIKKISRIISRHWKKLARELDFDETDIGAIEYRDPFDLEEQIANFFNKWKRKSGNDATKETLLAAIISISSSLPIEIMQALRENGIVRATSIQSTVVESKTTPISPPVQLQKIQLNSDFRPQGIDLITKESKFESSYVSWKGIKLSFLSSGTPNFSVSVVGAGHFLLPDNTKLVTALYYIRFNGQEEAGSSDHVWIELQHCACITKDSQNARLQFVFAKLPSVSLPYQLSLSTEQMSASISPQSGVVCLPCQSSSHGYLVGIVKHWSRSWIFASTNLRSKYYLRAVGRYINEIEYEIHVVVVKEMAPFIEMIDDKYCSDQFVTWGEAELTLLEHSPKPFFQSALTFSSVTTTSKDWKASFSTQTSIYSSALESPESYTMSSLLPRVTVHLTRDNDSTGTSTFYCKMKLSGTASPHTCHSLSLTPSATR